MKILYYFFTLIFITLFFYFIINYYISDQNIKKINYNRINIDSLIKEKTKKIPFLKNDTNNVIEFNNSFNSFEKSKPRKFWDLFVK